MRGKKTKQLWDKPEYRKHMSDIHMKADAGYSALHKWVRKWKGKPDTCEFRGRTGCRIEYANKDHTYKRVLDDYIALCVPCHFKFDQENNNKTAKNQFS